MFFNGFRTAPESGRPRPRDDGSGGRSDSGGKGSGGVFIAIIIALVAGTVWVNCFFIRDLRTPFGGVGDSGVGREGGDFSREFFTEAKAVVMQL